MSKHVFVSHAHKDAAAATAVVTALEQRDIPCWIAPRDVTPGGSYAEAILTAIENASCFVLIYSTHSNVSSHVLREVERALKFGVNIVPVRFDDSTPSKSLDYLLATVHWLAIPEESRERSIARAAEQIADWLTNFLKNPATPLPSRRPSFQNAMVTSLEPSRRSPGMFVGTVATFFALLTAAGFATGRLPFHKEQVITKSNSAPATAKAASAKGPGPVIADLAKTARNSQSFGYAGVSPIRGNAAPDRATRPNENTANLYAPPPPPPPPPFDNGSSFGPPPDNRFGPPPPPPPPPGAPMFGRGPGGPPGPGGPRP